MISSRQNDISDVLQHIYRIGAAFFCGTAAAGIVSLRKETVHNIEKKYIKILFWTELERNVRFEYISGCG